MTDVLVREGKGDFTQGHQEEHMETEADTRVTLSQAKGCQGLLATTRTQKHGTDTRSEPPERTNPADTLISDLKSLEF